MHTYKIWNNWSPTDDTRYVTWSLTSFVYNTNSEVIQRPNSSGAFILKVSLNAADLTTEEIVLFSRGGRTRRPHGGPAGPLQFAVTPACVLLKHLDQNNTRGSVPTRWPRVSENKKLLSSLCRKQWRGKHKYNTRRIKTDCKQTAGSQGPKHQSSGIKLEHKMLLNLCIIAPELSQCVYQLIYWSGNSEVLVLDRLSNIWTVFTHKT